jgi:hypothetical protein
MHEFFRTAIYTKNIPTLERTLRVVASLAAGGAAAFYVEEPWMRWAAGASGVMLALTGVFGFCPACYMAGRRIKNRLAA